MLLGSERDSSNCVSGWEADFIFICLFHFSVFFDLNVLLIVEHASVELQFIRTINTNTMKSCISQSFIYSDDISENIKPRLP